MCSKNEMAGNTICKLGNISFSCFKVINSLLQYKSHKNIISYSSQHTHTHNHTHATLHIRSDNRNTFVRKLTKIVVIAIDCGFDFIESENEFDD